MGVAERAHAREAAAKSTADALATVNLERLLAYADTWRRYADEWTEQSKHCQPGSVEPLRTRAQLALYAAHEADELFRMHEQRLIQSPPAARATNALPPVRAMPARDNVYVAPAESGGHRLARTPSRSRARRMVCRP